MSIATQKQNQASERFLLVRLRPSRIILPEFVSGTTYQMTFEEDVVELKLNGATLPKVTGSLSLNTWRYDETTKVLEVSLSQEPDRTENILVASFYLYFTATKYRAIGQNPEAPNTLIREWRPKIINYPSIVQSIRNIIYGVFTLSDMQIQIIDEDGYIKKQLDDDGSFYNKDIQVWLCIDEVANIQRVYIGTVRSISCANSTVTLSCVDRFNTLNQKALMGDSSNEAYFLRDAASFPNLDPEAHGKPCPFIVGKYSRFVTEAVNNDISGISNGLRMAQGHPAYCTSFANDFGTSTNRTWGCCRQDSAVNQTSASIQAVSFVAGTNGYAYVRMSSVALMQVGDTLRWRTGSSGPYYYGLISAVGNFTVSSVNYNLLVDTLGVKIMSVGDNVPITKSFAVIIRSRDEVIYPVYDRDYTITETSTTGNNYLVSIVFNNNFEANFSSFFSPEGYLEPQRHEVEFRTSVVEWDQQYVSFFLYRICQAVGLNPDSLSFSDAQEELPVHARFHIPYFDESDYKNYLDYAQDVLSSVLGYLTLDTDFRVNYRLFKAPEVLGEVRDSSLMLQGNTSARVDYSDIATQIIAYNPHCDSQLSIGAPLSPSETRTSLAAQYLNGLINVDRFRHVLEEITTRIDTHIALKSRPRTIYRFATATQDIDTSIGDDLTLENKIVLGQNTESTLKVTGIDKSPSRTIIEASDLRGL